MSKKLLIVDDEVEIREMLSRHFEFLGYNTSTAGNGQEALNYLGENKVDIIITDIMMPVMNGVTLLKRIRQEYPMVQVIMITGYVSLDNALSCMRAQANTCIFKPLEDLTELEEAVEKAFQTIETWKRKFKELRGMKISTRANTL